LQQTLTISDNAYDRHIGSKFVKSPSPPSASHARESVNDTAQPSSPVRPRAKLLSGSTFTNTYWGSNHTWDSLITIPNAREEIPPSLPPLKFINERIQSDSNSPVEDHGHRSPNAKRAGSVSSLDFWSRSRHHSRAGSVISSKNSSLYGYAVFDPEEQNISSPISAPQSAHGSGSCGGVSSFKLPPPPVQLGHKLSFECDICGKEVHIKRKRNWRYRKLLVIPNTNANLTSGSTFLKTWNHMSVPLKIAQTLSLPFREDAISSNMK